MKYQKIKEALQALQEGKLVLVMDDKERENEGDLICSAQSATTENVNFMATYAKGLICMPMSESLANRLMLSPMVEDNTDNHETAFTVSIDYKDTTTGISAEERGLTARMCVVENINPLDFRFVFIPMKGDPQLFRGAADKATYKKAIDEFLLK